MSEAALIGLFVATVQFATLVFLAALGELIAERAGVLNLGVEGMMAMGAVSGFMVGLETGSPWAAFFAAAAVGALVGG
ncbi:MAG: ABC transporter permease, partial [Acidimicrobiia bacterium]|nr:ABC transporter permease [Acidimicrobiia bacterium]MYJ61229.1 ABC transporter permease [Acidimicrobiia bacterium]